MQQALLLLVLAIVLLIPTTSLLLLLGALFPQITTKSREIIEESQWRTFLLGLVNVLFLGALMFISVFLVQEVGQIFFLLGLAVLVIFSIGTMVGLTSLTQLVGVHILPDHTQPQQYTRGAVILILALLTPYIGWFLFFPYTVILAFGGVVTAAFRKWRQNRTYVESEEAQE